MKFLAILCLPALAFCGTFSGTVVDLAGAPIVGAVVKTLADSVTTSGNGTWNLAHALSVARRSWRPVSVASHLVVENGRARMVYGGVDASGHRSLHGSVHAPSLQAPAARSNAAVGTDTLKLYWKGKRLVVLPVSSSDSVDIVLKIDTAWSDDQGVPWNARIAYGSLKDDRDAHVYRTVTIGTQTWMAENLDYTLDSSWCYEGAADSCVKYGRLYTWAPLMGLADSCNSVSCSTLVTVEHQGICPNEWHVPSDTEWSALVQYVDSVTSGTKLKSTSGWSDTGNGIDLYGFRALAAGFRDYDSSWFAGVGTDAGFWTSPKYASRHAIYRFVPDGDTKLYSVDDWKTWGLSARCLKD
jgi:uncharacterized protein (TIGR02145 family)